MERYHHILLKHGLIEFDGSLYVRTALECPRTPASELVGLFRHQFPSYRAEIELISITGPRLADCLTGRESPISLLFRPKESRRALEDHYVNSPMLATATDLLVDLISRAVAEKEGATARIIEVGGGSQGDKVEYTFTDIAPTLVAQASKTMGKYKWMKFETLNIESEPPAQLQGKFDVVIATNCVHATTNRVAVLRNTRQLLNLRGFVALSEVTQAIDWYDIVWGLLGWLVAV
ncbi:hypothetical protein F4779DRAFT_613457 [Xylariaceae sp. FL0662B]|nr:hypothetical protein F4779DRAFT_613457 [Xylariaceae sp. FL0662B]